MLTRVWPSQFDTVFVACPPSDGTRWRYSYRDSRGRRSSRRSFATERAAARDREQRMGRVRQAVVYVSRMTFGEFFPAWLRTRRPYLTAGTWADYLTMPVRLRKGQRGRWSSSEHFAPMRSPGALRWSTFLASSPARFGR